MNTDLNNANFFGANCYLCVIEDSDFSEINLRLASIRGLKVVDSITLNSYYDFRTQTDFSPLELKELGWVLRPQRSVTMPGLGSIYTDEQGDPSGDGIAFEAPVDFLITQVRMPLEIKDATQSIAVVVNDQPPSWNPDQKKFWPAFWKHHSPSGEYVNTLIPVKKGQYVYIIASLIDQSGKSYFAIANKSRPRRTSILGFDTYLWRALQNNYDDPGIGKFPKNLLIRSGHFESTVRLIDFWVEPLE